MSMQLQLYKSLRVFIILVITLFKSSLNRMKSRHAGSVLLACRPRGDEWRGLHVEILRYTYTARSQHVKINGAFKTDPGSWCFGIRRLCDGWNLSTTNGHKKYKVWTKISPRRVPLLVVYWVVGLLLVKKKERKEKKKEKRRRRKKNPTFPEVGTLLKWCF